jgi:hypothetical protein
MARAYRVETPLNPIPFEPFSSLSARVVCDFDVKLASRFLFPFFLVLYDLPPHRLCQVLNWRRYLDMSTVSTESDRALIGRTSSSLSGWVRIAEMRGRSFFLVEKRPFAMDGPTQNARCSRGDRRCVVGRLIIVAPC